MVETKGESKRANFKLDRPRGLLNRACHLAVSDVCYSEQSVYVSQYFRVM